MIPNPTERFTGRVESYRRFRPTYPAAVVDLLRRECLLGFDSQIADIAAGTGLLTEIFLAAGFAVTAVEPNAEMRTACAALQSRYPKLTLIDGTAEATGLPDHSVDLITVAQAMHWFDLKKTRAEFTRILKPGGWCAVIYNNRCMSGDAFHDGYEQLLIHYGIDYREVQHRHFPEERTAEFFAPSTMHRANFPNPQALIPGSPRRPHPLLVLHAAAGPPSLRRDARRNRPPLCRKRTQWQSHAATRLRSLLRPSGLLNSNL